MDMATPREEDTLHADCVVSARCDFVPNTPPTSVSADATNGNSSSMTSPSASSVFNLMPSSLTMTSPTGHFNWALQAPPTVEEHHSLPTIAFSRRIPLAIQVRRVRIFVVALCLVGCLAWCVNIMENGIVIAKGNSRYDDYSVLAAKAEQLNFYFGTVASLVALPFQIVASIVFPVVLLIFMTENSMLNDSNWWLVGVLLVQGCFITILTNAFSTTYVDSPGPVVIFRGIIPSDLFNQPSAASISSIPNNGTVPIRPSVDTMLRTAIVPPYVRSNEPKCISGRPVSKSLTASFGFYTSPWLQNMASKGIPQRASLNITAQDWLPRPKDDQPATPRQKLPYNITVAANLAIHGVEMLNRVLEMPLGINCRGDFIKRSRQASAKDDTDAFLRATAEYLYECLAPQSEFGFSMDSKLATVEFSSLDLDHTRVSLDAITIQLPFKPRLIQRRVKPTVFHVIDDEDFNPAVDGDLVDENGDLVYQIDTKQECGARGCWLTQPSNSKEDKSMWRYKPDVRVYSRCAKSQYHIGDDTDATLSCLPEERLTNSVAVGAVSTSLSADRMVEFLAPGYVPEVGPVRIANITNLQRTMSISFGVLRWEVENLAEQLDALCLIHGGDQKCEGLRFPLTNGEVVLADKTHFITSQLSTIVGADRGRSLVSIVTDLDDGMFLPLRSVKEITSEIPRRRPLTKDQAPWPCSPQIEMVTDSIELNHWYIDHGLQEVYTAGLFHLFQFGVNHSVVSRGGGGHLPREVDLQGNVEAYAFLARIPRMSATLSQIAGAFFLVAVAIVVCAGKRRTYAIRELTDVHRVARVHLVDQFFPKLLLKCMVFDTPEGQSLAPFRIVAMRLHHKTEEGDLFVTLPADTGPSSLEDRSGITI